jgi:hypothetical protein
MTFKELYTKWKGPLMEAGDSPAKFLPFLGFEGDVGELATQFAEIVARARGSAEPTLGLIEVGIFLGAEWQDRLYRERVKVIEGRLQKLEAALPDQAKGAGQ